MCPIKCREMLWMTIVAPFGEWINLFFLLSEKNVSKEKRERVTSDKFLSRSRILLLLITLRELWRHEVNILREKFLNKLMLLDARAIKITCAPKNLHLVVEKIQYQLNSITIKYVLHAPFLSIFSPLHSQHVNEDVFISRATTERGILNDIANAI